ncbi:HlyD family efflux transporter periplasmic adaptor subunit [Shewanella seohaensis]|uniref:HlyD family efflux transporter periplasmic adaptor subunit n=1 Tax=Shewanella seohaensis TaxID=755175 RepID=UPI0021CA4CC0|nr:HlyD family efflux transporter periplasmic adaptor subunit [Shewanella seohaensis]UXM81196.1 HlyD family efflux transporter periplasmic adaptor subunit [Shewanella seohaensis]
MTQPVSFIGFTVLISALILCALLFLYFSEYQRNERVQGYIEPAMMAIRLSTPKSTNEGQLLVQLGEQVQQNQTLVQKLHSPSTMEKSFILKAPFAGTVTEILWPSGEDIDSSKPSISLLPQPETLFAIVYVPSRVIGQLALGQVLQMRVEAFPYQHFGVQTATLVEIGSLPVGISEAPSLSEPSYKLTLALTEDAKKLPLRAGMRLEVDISSAPRRLLEWLFIPNVVDKGQN